MNIKKQSAWSEMSKEQRSVEMKRRMEVARDKRQFNSNKPNNLATVAKDILPELLNNSHYLVDAIAAVIAKHNVEIADAERTITVAKTEISRLTRMQRVLGNDTINTSFQEISNEKTSYEKES